MAQKVNETGCLFSGLDQNEIYTSSNRRFPEITGEDNLIVFSYSGRVKSPEWRRSGQEPICDSFRSSGMDLL